METVKKILRKILNCHIYDDKIETAIKVIVFILTGIVGVVIVSNTEDKRALGGAYFIYTLSLLVEIVPKVASKKDNLARIFLVIFIIIVLIEFFLSFFMIFGTTPSKSFCKGMIVLIWIIIGWLFLDLIVCFIEPVNIDESNDGELINVFNERLLAGNLGDIK
ncbi:MAG: hypothetical protein NC122_05015 [Faecalibacterium sp.]|nr:hypothetical protein [Ruminococcus sp.]MCM1391878.1 hypothetical protein [Ruminococcus sp.]MCM1485546.1 hypothetical protein [Faecalibacterium sp.]